MVAKIKKKRALHYSTLPFCRFNHVEMKYLSNESKVYIKYIRVPSNVFNIDSKYIAVDRFNLMQIILGVSRAMHARVFFSFIHVFSFSFFSHHPCKCTSTQTLFPFYFWVIVLRIHFKNLY